MRFLYYITKTLCFGILHFLVEETVGVQLFYNNILESTLTVQHSLPVDCCYSLLGSWERVGWVDESWLLCMPKLKDRKSL